MTVPADKNYADVLGLHVDVEPGLHQVQGVLTLTAVAPVRIATGAQLLGPTASVAIDTWLHYLGGISEMHPAFYYGSLLSDLWYWLQPGQSFQARFTGTLNVAEPGTLSVQAGGIPETSTWPFDAEFEVYEWQVDGGEVAHTDTVPQSGGGAAQITPDGVAETVTFRRQMPAVPGYQYQAGAWLWADEPWADAGIVVRWHDGNGDILREDSAAGAIEAGVWVQRVLNVAAPDGAVDAYLEVRMGGTPPSSAVLYVDDVTWAGFGGTVRVSAGSFLAAAPM
ncbi:hypothetical protein HDA43_006841 [Streptosporangium sandarakinum]|uniref:Uncharacterized protein n=1 Tax=Streptosporangium sandarakinum TaxID=1260955 RepID=A0A852V807_9ACTN|nr:hypothetical protein [Streptosporangium sandarakinum]NYF44599.1 hypothetical protein [Streptosporangium sandarakinum]